MASIYNLRDHRDYDEVFWEMFVKQSEKNGNVCLDLLNKWAEETGEDYKFGINIGTNEYYSYITDEELDIKGEYLYAPVPYLTCTLDNTTWAYDDISKHYFSKGKNLLDIFPDAHDEYYKLTA